MDSAEFSDRSAIDPEATLVLRAEGAVDPELYARAAHATAVFVASRERTLDEVLACEDDWPVILALPPEL
ncbi:hypothetical protein ACFY05_07490 [Microtetraspora fusca]|uniref:Uncharacterized protein n=1 Tax=Microtetraspora fusca TaxID=1997 RepID=A0ABW6V3R1_MICFU